MKNEEHTQTESAASSIAELMEKLIEIAPEGDHSGHRLTIAPRPILVRESNGWGRKYCSEIELSGTEWLATYSEARAAVASGGIVAMLGGRGPGKTQMAAEIARGGEWPEDKREYARSDGGPIAITGKTAIYRRAMDIFLDLREAAKNHVKSSEKEVMAKLSGAGLLVMDEFQERGETDWENRMMKNILDKRYASERPTIIIANMERKNMGDALGDSIKDRILENGIVLEFNWPSFRRAKP